MMKFYHDEHSQKRQRQQNPQSAARRVPLSPFIDLKAVGDGELDRVVYETIQDLVATTLLICS